MLDEKEISKYKFARILKRPDTEKCYSITLGIKSKTPRCEGFIKYLGYKEHSQYVNITLRAVLGEYVYYQRDDKCWRAPYNPVQKAIWYCEEDLVNLSVENRLEVKLGGFGL